MNFNNLIKISIAGGCLMLALSPLQSYAQFGMAIGAKGGVAVTSFKGDDAGNVKARTGGLGGLFISAQFGEVFALQPEFLIGQRGGVLTKNNMENNITLTYFDIPVLAKFRLPIDKVFYPHILLGPDFAFNTNSSVTSRDTQTGSSVVISGGDVNKTDVGALVGAGIDIQSNKIFLTLDARYGYSFNSLGSNNQAVALNFRNTGWSFTAGIGFRLFSKSE